MHSGAPKIGHHVSKNSTTPEFLAAGAVPMLTDGDRLLRCVQVRQTLPRQCGRRRQMASKTKSRNKKPMGACHSWFFLYWVREKDPAESAGSLAAVRRGRKSGTARAYSSKDARWRICSSVVSLRITME